ncbi:MULTISPECIES: hypothetical protein [unclassified Burkholderia]|nr:MULTISPECIES: hypothetical protein [unclassified Burkholderia]
MAGLGDDEWLNVGACPNVSLIERNRALSRHRLMAVNAAAGVERNV